ncbi:MAG: ribonuclease HII [Pseudomonadota bacterium]
MSPNLSLEQQHQGPVAGIDEVGRGPLAGPVVTAAFVFKIHTPLPDFIHEITDSKKLTAAKRQKLYDQLLKQKGITCDFALGEASVGEIDQINILQATLLAMQRAAENLSWKPVIALIDGPRVPKLACPTLPVTKGDQVSLSIAAASIIAKVTRDAYMAQLAREHPEYLWEKNAGYGTADHLKALQQHGPTPHHRRSFAPVRRVYLARA